MAKITLTLPDSLYAWLEDIAHESGLSLEETIRIHLAYERIRIASPREYSPEECNQAARWVLDSGKVRHG